MKIKADAIRWEQIHNEYLERVRKVMKIDIQESPRLVDALAEEIYGFLRKRKLESERPNDKNN